MRILFDRSAAQGRADQRSRIGAGNSAGRRVDACLAQRAMTEAARAWHSKLAEDFAQRAVACPAPAYAPAIAPAIPVAG